MVFAADCLVIDRRRDGHRRREEVGARNAVGDRRDCGTRDDSSGAKDYALRMRTADGASSEVTNAGRLSSWE